MADIYNMFMGRAHPYFPDHVLAMFEAMKKMLDDGAVNAGKIIAHFDSNALESEARHEAEKACRAYLVAKARTLDRYHEVMRGRCAQTYYYVAPPENAQAFYQANKMENVRSRMATRQDFTVAVGLIPGFGDAEIRKTEKEIALKQFDHYANHVFIPILNAHCGKFGLPPLLKTDREPFQKGVDFAKTYCAQLRNEVLSDRTADYVAGLFGFEKHNGPVTVDTQRAYAKFVANLEGLTHLQR